MDVDLLLFDFLWLFSQLGRNCYLCLPFLVTYCSSVFTFILTVTQYHFVNIL